MASRTPDCVAFNTEGRLKSSIHPQARAAVHPYRERFQAVKTVGDRKCRGEDTGSGHSGTGVRKRLPPCTSPPTERLAMLQDSRTAKISVMLVLGGVCHLPG